MERVSTVDLPVLTKSDQELLILKYTFLFFPKSYLDEEVNCIEPFPYVRVPRKNSSWSLSLHVIVANV